MYKIGKLLVLLLATTQIKAATITGHISDAKTKETLVGANVYIKTNTQLHDISGLDGSFKIKNISPGEYTLVISFISYATQEKEITVSSDADIINLDFRLEPEVLSLDQVEIVSNYNKESGNYARNKEKVSDNVLNVISANSIQLLPDITAAGVLQRVSGVTMQKTSNSGEAQYAIIRGMDKRYNYTLVNGIKIPSPDNKNRYVPMDIFPSELLSRIEVIKALTPEMEGDAVGGAMNLVLRDAPDKLLVKGNFSAGYNQLLLDRPFYEFDRKAVSLKSPSEIHGTDYVATPADFPIDNLKFNPVQPMPNMTGGLSIGNRFLKKKNLHRGH